jgi:hypothetical protein
MAAIILESLVLRGVAVREDALAVELRLGTSVKAKPQAPANRNSMRHPPAGGRLPQTQGVSGPDVDYFPLGDTPGAGRSRRQPGQPAARGSAQAQARWARDC